MRVFVNRISGVKWYAMDDRVTDEGDAWRIDYAKVSLPKNEWEQHEQEERKHTAQQGEGADHA